MDYCTATVKLSSRSLPNLRLDRQPIGRPWITVAIDIFSRMIAGFYISLDPPGALSTGLCLVHAMLPKHIWLARHHIETPWPIQGRIEALQCDNAREFRGNMLDRACDNYGSSFALASGEKALIWWPYRNTARNLR